MPIDMEKYRKHLALYNLDKDREEEIIRYVYMIMDEFISAAFNKHPVQHALLVRYSYTFTSLFIIVYEDMYLASFQVSNVKQKSYWNLIQLVKIKHPVASSGVLTAFFNLLVFSYLSSKGTGNITRRDLNDDYSMIFPRLGSYLKFTIDLSLIFSIASSIT